MHLRKNRESRKAACDKQRPACNKCKGKYATKGPIVGDPSNHDTSMKCLASIKRTATSRPKKRKGGEHIRKRLSAKRKTPGNFPATHGAERLENRVHLDPKWQFRDPTRGRPEGGALNPSPDWLPRGAPDDSIMVG